MDNLIPDLEGDGFGELVDLSQVLQVDPDLDHVLAPVEHGRSLHPDKMEVV